MNRILPLIALASLLLSCNSKQGGKYTYSSNSFGSDNYTSVSFEVENDTLAYLWAQEKFYSDQNEACHLYEKLKGNNATIINFPKSFVVKKGNRIVEFNGLKSPTVLSEEQVAFMDAKFGMSFEDVKALPGFADWVPYDCKDDMAGRHLLFRYWLDRDEYKEVNGGDYYEKSNGVDHYDLKMDFDHAGKLFWVKFDIPVNHSINSVKENLLYMIRCRYGLSEQDKIVGDFHNRGDFYDWSIGRKSITLQVFQNSIDIHVHFRP